MKSAPAIFTLPWPPSVNTYWRNVNGRMVTSAAGRAYQEEVRVLLMSMRRQDRIPAAAFSGPVAVDIVACPPDKRRRDLDNALKAPLDAMKGKGRLYLDDGQIDDLRIRRGPVMDGGELWVEISEFLSSEFLS